MSPAESLTTEVLSAPEGSRTLLKQEPCTHIEHIVAEDQEILRKTYMARPGLAWRALWMPSRARREYESLRAARAAGVPAVEALAWGEERRFGCPIVSWLSTRFEATARSAREVFAEPPGESAWARARARRGVARGIGTLLRRLHDAGILWCDMTTRNVLVIDAPRGEVLACDMPSAICYPRPITGTRAACIDLYDAFASDSRKRELRGADRWALLLAYTRGEHAQARKLFRALECRGRGSHRWRKGLTKSVRLYLPSALRSWSRRG